LSQKRTAVVSLIFTAVIGNTVAILEAWLASEAALTSIEALRVARKSALS
jgi:hypothetical protein